MGYTIEDEIEDEIERTEEAIADNNLTIMYLKKSNQYDRLLEYEKYNDIHRKRLRLLKRESKKYNQ